MPLINQEPPLLLCHMHDVDPPKGFFFRHFCTFHKKKLIFRLFHFCIRSCVARHVQLVNIRDCFIFEIDVISYSEVLSDKKEVEKPQAPLTFEKYLAQFPLSIEK